MKNKFFYFFIFLPFCLFSQNFKQSDKLIMDIFRNPYYFEQEYKDSLIIYDFSSVWTQTNNEVVLGFIGKDFERIKVKILSVSKDKNSYDKYVISGKTKVKNNITEFKGFILVTHIRVINEKDFGYEEECIRLGIKKRGILIAEYHFEEDILLEHSGKFDGVLISNWYLNKNDKIQYDDLEISFSDGFCNNQFVGTWKDYKTLVELVCNWGDYRIPFSIELDTGVAEFYPNSKYLKNGWQTYFDANFNDDENAKAIESEEWWK